MLSIIIPSRNEQFLVPTILDLLGKAKGGVEIIVVLEGYWEKDLPDDKRVRVIHHGEAKGMRQSINDAVAIAQGDYIMKIDAHCMVGEGFDTILTEDCQDNWVLIPTRKRLDAENWCITDVGKVDVDYERVTNPKKDDMHGTQWNDRSRDRKDIKIDDNPTFQGSCWFMKKDYFHKLDLMDAEKYGMFFNEAQEISFKAWLSGGRVMTDKNTWYAHLHKGKKYGRGYAIGSSQRQISSKAMITWVENRGWAGQKIDFSSFIEYFNMPEWSEEDITELKKKDKFHKKIQPTKLSIMDAVIDNRDELARFFVGVGAEIGVEQGKYTEILAKYAKKVYAVDAWAVYRGYREHVSQDKLDKFKETVWNKFKNTNVEVMVDFSMDAVKQFDDEELDWVYIDGNHEFQNVTNDIAQWSKKVKKGGIVAGHDFKRFGGKYGLNSCHVKDVVQAWCYSHKIDFKTTNDKNPSWYFIKK